MARDHRLVAAEQLGKLRQIQPQRLVLQPTSTGWPSPSKITVSFMFPHCGITDAAATGGKFCHLPAIAYRPSAICSIRSRWAIFSRHPAGMASTP